MIFAAVITYGANSIISGLNRPETPTPPPIFTSNSVDRTIDLADARPPAPLSVSTVSGGPHIGHFGRRRVGGRVLLSARDNTNNDWLVIAIAGGVISYEGLRIDGVRVLRDGAGLVTTPPYHLSSVKITLYDGGQTTADAGLVAAFPGWTSQFIGYRTAYAVVKITKSANVAAFVAGVPAFTFDILGFKCFDPRNPAHNVNDRATWAASTNAAIQNANYLIHELGAAMPVSRIDWASVAAAANVCDVPVTVRAGGVEPAYSAALSWTTDERHETIERRAGDAHAGGMFLVGQKYRARSGAFSAPATIPDITPAGYVGGGLTFSDTPPLASLPNGVRGTFTSTAHGFEPRDFPSYQNAADLAADGAREAWLDLDLSAVTSASQAQRLARLAYNKARQGFAAAAELSFAHFDIIADDLVSVTDAAAGFNAQTFRVATDELRPDFTVALALQAESAAFYAFTPATDETPFVAAPSVLGVTGTGSAAGDGGPNVTAGGVYYNTGFSGPAAGSVAGPSKGGAPTVNTYETGVRFAVNVAPGANSPAATLRLRLSATKVRTEYNTNGTVFAETTTNYVFDAVTAGGLAAFDPTVLTRISFIPIVDVQAPVYFQNWTQRYSSAGSYTQGGERTVWTLNSLQLETTNGGSGGDLWRNIILGPKALAAVGAATEAASTFYALATPCAPYVQSGSGLSYLIKTNQVAGSKSTNIELWAFNDATATTGGALIATTANVSGGAVFSVTGAAGSGKYYRVACKSTAAVAAGMPNYSDLSNPLLIVYQ